MRAPKPVNNSSLRTISLTEANSDDNGSHLVKRHHPEYCTKMYNGFQPPEPDNDFREMVEVGRRWSWYADATVIYHSSWGGAIDQAKCIHSFVNDKFLECLTFVESH